jgi:hypothetical protein
MDYLGYRLNWRQQEEGDKLPNVRIHATAMQWDLREGGHPTLLRAPKEFYERPPFADPQNPDISLDLQLRPMGCVHGHNTLADVGTTSLIDVDINIPISPLFARDLCGRTIYLGYGPEKKEPEEWDAYTKIDAEGQPANPGLLGVTFPRHCRVLDENVPGAELIEAVFFTKFRTLDMSFDYVGTPSGHTDMLSAGLYPAANLFPYKIRPDTFYTDGYKLPQTQMVFALPDISAAQAQQRAEALLNTWQARPQGQSYQDFYQAQGGEEWAERLFRKGCTLIPTFEAHNSFHKVSRRFELEDYWPGRAVAGLHEVLEKRASAAPVGTILEVLEPGYVTAHTVKPARVIVSDGSGYTSPNAGDPAPLIPNLFIPHQRTTSNWWGTWLPTHPEHFEPPALWGWEQGIGRFVQLRGPLWDPLHYYYESTDIILQAFETPRKDNRWLVDVPEEMDNRFYPVIPMPGFDTLQEEERFRRFGEAILPRSGCKRIATEEPSAGIGYHPLPLQFEFELDPFWFPEFHPPHRLVEDIPEELKDRLASIIQSNVLPQAYLRTVQGPEEAVWLVNPDILQEATGEPLEDYPFLVRYVEPDIPEEEIFAMSTGLFLENIDPEILNKSPQELRQGLDGVDDLEKLAPGLFDAVWDVRERAAHLMRLRHEVYRKNPALYAYAWWACIPANMLESFFLEWESNAKAGTPQTFKTKAGDTPISAYLAPEERSKD